MDEKFIFQSTEKRYNMNKLDVADVQPQDTVSGYQSIYQM